MLLGAAGGGASLPCCCVSLPCAAGEGAMEATTTDGDGAGLLRARLVRGEGMGDHCPSVDAPNLAEGDSGGDPSGDRSAGEEAGEGE